MKKLLFLILISFLLVTNLAYAEEQEITNGQTIKKTGVELYKEHKDLFKLTSQEATKKLLEVIPQEIETTSVDWINEHPYYNFVNTENLATVENIKIKLRKTTRVDAETGEISPIHDKDYILEKNGLERIEQQGELLFLDKNSKEMSLFNIDPETKEKIRNKMFINYIEPLIDCAIINEIRQPYIPKRIYKVLIQKKNDCDSSFVAENKILEDISNEDYDFKIIKTNLKEMPAIWDDECIIKAADEDTAEKLLTTLDKQNLTDSVKEGFKESKIMLFGNKNRNNFWNFIFRLQSLFR